MKAYSYRTSLSLCISYFYNYCPINKSIIFGIKKRLKLIPVKGLSYLTIGQQMNKASIFSFFDKKKAETYTCKEFELFNYWPTNE